MIKMHIELYTFSPLESNHMKVFYLKRNVLGVLWHSAHKLKTATSQQLLNQI